MKEIIDKITEIIEKSSIEVLCIIYILSFSEIKRRLEKGKENENSKK